MRKLPRAHVFHRDSLSFTKFNLVINLLMIEFPSSRKRGVMAHKMENLRSRGSSRLSARKARDDRLDPRPELQAARARHADGRHAHAHAHARSGEDADAGGGTESSALYDAEWLARVRGRRGPGCATLGRRAVATAGRSPPPPAQADMRSLSTSHWV